LRQHGFRHRKRGLGRPGWRNGRRLGNLLHQNGFGCRHRGHFGRGRERRRHFGFSIRRRRTVVVTEFHKPTLQGGKSRT
jgi:hypothetical protein